MRFCSLILCALLLACDDDGTAQPSTSTSTSTSTTTTTTASEGAADAQAVDCGEDFSSLDQLGPPSVARQCFLDANTAGKAATLTIHEVRATGEYTARLRSNTDRTVDVVPDDGPTSTCAGLAPDERRVFVLAGCR
jgi:hypothetical protein